MEIASEVCRVSFKIMFNDVDIVLGELLNVRFAAAAAATATATRKPHEHDFRKIKILSYQSEIES